MAEIRENRRPGWLELFFDLVFVVVVAQLTNLVEAEPDLMSIVVVAGLLIAVWTTWNNTTLHSNAAGEVAPRFRVFVFAAMAGVAMMAVAIPSIYGGGQIIFAVGYAIARLAMWPLWSVVRDSLDPGSRVVGPIIYGPVLAAGWLASIAIPDPWRGVAWGVLLAIEIVFMVRSLPNAPHHSAHMIERVGLFIMIVLGESVLSLIRAIAHDVTPSAWLVGGLSFAVVCALWWRYFDIIGGLRDRLEASGSGAVFRDVLVIAHYLIVLALVLLAAGLGTAIEHASDPHVESGTILVLVSGLAIYELAQLFMAARFSVRPSVALIKLIPTVITVVLLVTGGAGWAPWVVVGVVLVNTVAEIGITTLLSRRFVAAPAPVG